MSTTTTQVGAIARRSVVRTSRQPASIIPPLVFPVALMAVNAGGLRSSTELPGLPDRLVPRLRARRAVHPGRALLDDERGHRHRARRPDGLHQPALAHRAARLGAPHGAARGNRRARRRAGGLLHRRRAVGGRDFESGPAGIAVLLVYGAIVALAFGALGAWLAYRTGSGETIQALFPVLFVFLFISSMNAPREPHRRRVVPHRGDAQPGLLHDRVRPEPHHHGLGLAGAGARVRLRDRARARLVRACVAGAPDADDEDVTA